MSILITAICNEKLLNFDFSIQKVSSSFKVLERSFQVRFMDNIFKNFHPPVEIVFELYMNNLPHKTYQISNNICEESNHKC